MGAGGGDAKSRSAAEERAADRLGRLWREGDRPDVETCAGWDGRLALGRSLGLR